MKWIKRLIPICGSLGLLAFLLSQVHVSQIIALLNHASLPWLAVGLAFYIATNVVRSYRTAALLQTPGGLAPLRMLPDMVLISLANNTLPSRSGELSFPYLMYERHRISLGESAGALVLMRVLDYVAVAVLFLSVTAVEAHHLASGAVRVAGIAFVLLFVSAGLVALLPWAGGWILKMVERLAQRLGIAAKRPCAWLLATLGKAVEALASVRVPRIAAAAGGMSLLGWLGTFAWFAAFMRALGYERPFLLVIMGATFAILAKAIPLVSVGGLGAHEAGWTLGFSLIGMAPVDAVASGLAVNVLTLIASAICGAAGLVYITLSRRRRSTRPGAPDPSAPDAPALGDGPFIVAPRERGT